MMHEFTKLLVAIIACDQIVSNTRGLSLPSIWGHAQQGSKGALKSFRIKSEIQIPETGRSFIAEEWADFGRRLQRFDLMDTEDGIRKTILINSDTSEIFHYKPFTCSLIENPKEALDEDLAYKFPKSDSFMLTGLGSLWSNSNNFTFTSTPIIPGEESRRKSIINGRKYGRYSIENIKDYPFKIKFYFRDPLIPAELRTLMVVDVESDNSRVANFKLRFKILTVELSPKLEDEYDVFKLPEGYGCKRKSQLDQTIPNSIIETLTLKPQSLNLEMVSMRPSDDKHDLDKWRSHSSSVKIIAGRMNLDNDDNVDYLVLETSEYTPRSNVSKPAQIAGLRRHKQVWSLGKGALSERSDTPPGNDRAWFFDIDERTGDCLGFGESSFHSETGVDLPTSCQDCATSSLHGPGVSLNLRTIQELLVVKDDHHLLKVEASSISPILSDFVSEKRSNVFKLKDQCGSVCWSGPVSIVRRQTYDNSTKQIDKWSLTKEPFHTSLKVIFFSEGIDKIVGITNINIIEMKSLYEASFHEELNVESCFKKPEANLQLPADPTPKEASDLARVIQSNIDFTLNYPVESKFVLGRLANDFYAKSSMYRQFLRSMYKIAGKELDLLQLADVKVSIGEDLIQVIGKLLQKPKIMSFHGQSGLKFPKENSKTFILSEFKSNAESCAESCLYFNCSIFSYCPYSRRCDVRIKSNDIDTQSLELDSNCSVFRPRAKRLNFDTLQMAHKLHHIVAEQCQDSDHISCPLLMEVEYRGADGTEKSLKIIPSYFETGGALKDQTDRLKDTDAEREQSQVGDEDGKLNSLRPKYIISREDSKYKLPERPNDQFPIQLAQYMTYEDCEALCDETDCASFSYCKIEKSCLVSRIHDITRQSSESIVEIESYCYIMARDELSKFFETLEVELPNELDSALTVSGPRECARECLNSNQSSVCRSFYFCPTSSKCYIGPNTDQDKGETSVSSADSTCTCNEYTRSLLTDYDKFYGKSLADEHRSSEILMGVGPETCALECSNKNGDCRAFHVCHDETAHLLTCVLAHYSDHKRLARALVDDSNCTSFLLSRGSIFRSLIDTVEDTIKTPEVESEFNIVGHIGLFLIWIAVGYTAMILIRLRK